MNAGKIITTAVVVGIALNVFDYVVHGLILQGMVYDGLEIMRQDASIVALIAADFVTALVFVWVYDKVRGSFDSGMGGGMTFGFYAGILMAFPGFIFNHLLLVGFTYSLAWVSTITLVVAMMLAGAVAGLMYANEGAGSSDAGGFAG